MLRRERLPQTGHSSKRPLVTHSQLTHRTAPCRGTTPEVAGFLLKRCIRPAGGKPDGHPYQRRDPCAALPADHDGGVAQGEIAAAARTPPPPWPRRWHPGAILDLPHV